MRLNITKISTLEVSKPRVCAYVRVSTDRAAQEDSFKFQSEYWNQKLSDNTNVEYVGLFADEGISGKAMRNRKGLNEMLDRVRNGQIDCIYTKSISRFARNYTELMAVVRELRDLGIPIVFEKENVDTLDPKCGLILSVMASLAEEELRSMSKNQQWAARKRFAAGIPEFKRAYGYEYIDGQLKIIPNEAKVVKEIFRLYLQGNGVVKVAQLMDASGNKPMKGGKWAKSSIRDMLKNEKYIGDSLLQKNIYELNERKINRGELPQYYVEGTHEAIISKDDFEEVQKRLKEAAKKFLPYDCSGAPLYPLSGKIKCGCCGTSYKRKTYAKGKTYESIKWGCKTKDLKTKAACASNDIKDEVINSLLVEAFNECMDQRRVFETRAEVETSLQALIASERELKELRVKGYISERQYRAETERLIEMIKSLESQIKTVKAKNIDLRKFKKSAEFSNEMADFLMQATVNDWTVTFRFKNGFEVTKKYTNGRAGNVNGKLCKHKT